MYERSEGASVKIRRNACQIEIDPVAFRNRVNPIAIASTLALDGRRERALCGRKKPSFTDFQRGLCDYCEPRAILRHGLLVVIRDY